MLGDETFDQLDDENSFCQFSEGSNKAKLGNIYESELGFMVSISDETTGQ